MVVSKEDMVNRACAQIGIDPIQSMTDQTHEGEAVQLTYDAVVEFMLGIYPFSFAKVTKQLSQDTDAPPFSGFEYRFSLPTERLGPPIKVRDSLTDETARFSDYILNGDKLHSNSTPLYAELLQVPDPHIWSGPFREAFVLALAAKFAMALRHDMKEHDALMTAAYGNTGEAYRGGAFGAAIRADSYGTPAKTLRHNSNPMTAAFSGG